MRQKFIMLVGLPASGKSTIAKQITNEHIIIHSSDMLREELYGDINYQGKNGELFQELHKRIRNDLKNGKSVIYDACNISKKRRIAFLSELKNIRCDKICLITATPYEECLKTNEQRERKIPKKVIERMYMNWQPPHKSEGWDKIDIFFREVDVRKYYLSELFFGENSIEGFNQNNSHHSLTLDKHCDETMNYIEQYKPYDNNLIMAGLLHDIGKPFTKTFKNTKGKITDDAHYYQHHSVGSYDSMFYCGVNDSNIILDISNLIYYHMHPHMSWRQSEKAKERDRRLLGEDMFDRVMLLHKADKLAH